MTRAQNEHGAGDETPTRSLGAELDEPPDDLIGTFIGGYRLAARIGRGGMGAVYVAFHPTLRRRVAIKVLLPELAASQVLQRRFFEEARAAAEIHDPRIVDVLDLARLPNGRCYIMMEYLPGESLEHMHRRLGRLAQEQAVAIVEQVLLGLHAAHDHGIVHRDLKPANLFVVDGGEGPARIKILDFGVAKLRPRPGSQGFTHSGAVIGTPGYMAPEQASGRSREVDARADLYAIGVVLYVLLSGRKPFASPDWVERLVEQRTTAPPPIVGVAAALERAVMRALAVDPDARFESAAAMREALLDAIGGETALEPIPRPVPELDEVPQLDGTIETGGSQPAAIEPAQDDAPHTARETPSAKRETARGAPRVASRWLVPAVAGAAVAGAFAVAAFMATRDRSHPGVSPATADATSVPIAETAADASASITSPPVDASAAVRSAPIDAAAAIVRRSTRERKRPQPVSVEAPPPPRLDPTPADAGSPPKPRPDPSLLRAGERRTFRGALRPGALSQSFPFSTQAGAALRLHVTSPTVEAIYLHLSGCPSSHAVRRLPRSEWDGCPDCEAFVDATTDRQECVIQVSGSMPGTFTVSVDRVK